MTNKLARYFLLILTICTLLWNQQINYLSQKIAIEKAYREKVESAVSRLIGIERFIVSVSVEFSTVGGTLKKTAEPQTGQSKSDDPLRTLGIVPGPQKTGTSSTFGSGTKKLSSDEYDIGRVFVTVGLDETLISGELKSEITSLIETIIPETKDCEPCIKIEKRQFLSSLKDERLKALEAQIKALEEGRREDKIKADSAKLNELEKQLADAKEIRDGYLAMAKTRDLQLHEQESLRFQQLMQTERERRYQDSLKFINTEERLERVIESKIKSDSTIIRETMSILKQQAGGEKDDESLLGMQIGDGSSGIMGSVLVIFLIIALMIVTFLAASNKKPKTIYLKPKEKEQKKKEKKAEKKKEAKGKDDADLNNEKGDAKEEKPDKDTGAESTPVPPPKPDEDAVRSEIRSLRQTAVSLTVGEKEGASALIKEWMSDNPNKKEEEAAEGE